MSGLFDDLPPPPSDGPYARPGVSVGISRCDVTAGKHGGNPDSEQAHADTFGKKDRHYELILEFIRDEGERGATCQEVAHGTWLPYQTCSGRISELLRDGRLRRDGRKRPTSTGSLASVLVVAEAAITKN